MHIKFLSPTEIRLAKYHASVEEALKQANAYNEKESKHDALHDSIEKIRIRLTQILNLPIRNTPTKQQQIELLRSLSVEQRKKSATISKIQSAAQRTLKLALEEFDKNNDIDSLKKLGITVREGANLYPENTKFIHIVHLLQEIGIYADDLLISMSSKDYEEPYIEIEIPRVEKIILFHKNDPDIIYISDTPYPARKKKYTVKINTREQSNWKSTTLQAVLVNTCIHKKINIGEREHIVAELKKIYPTKNAFLKIRMKGEKIGLKIGGRGLDAISTMFGIEEDPNIREIFYELAEAIYEKPNTYTWERLDIKEKPSDIRKIESDKDMSLGEKKMETDRQNADKNEEYPLIHDIKKLYPTAHDLLTLTIKERQLLKIEGLGLNQIARLLELEWKPEDSFRDHLEFVAHIYGENEEIQTKREEVNKGEYEVSDKEEIEILKANIKEQFQTSKEFLEMDRTTKNTLKILGLGLIAIAKKLGIQNDPIKSMDRFVDLAQAIYEKDEIIKLYLAVRDPKKISDLIKKIYPTKIDFESASHIKLKKLKIADKKINALASTLGVMGDPLVDMEARRVMIERIYETPTDKISPITHVRRRSNPDNEGSVDTHESWKKDVLQEYPTSEDFLTMGKEKRYTCKIRDRGLKYLASVFKIEGDPIKQTKVFFSLAKAIYGDESYIEKCEADMRFGEFPSHYRFKKQD